MEIGLHEVGDDVDVRVVGLCLRPEDVQQFDDVVVFEKFCL